MTCEDYDERNGPGIVEKVALLIAPLLASRRDPRAGAVTAPRREEAIVTVLLTMVNASDLRPERRRSRPGPEWTTRARLPGLQFDSSCSGHVQGDSSCRTYATSILRDRP